MKPTTETRETFSSPNLQSAAFGISEKNMHKIAWMLRSGVYTDKPLAVLREYASNAWDAHRMVGKSDVPIRVTVPTRQDPTLRIRDFGPGLSQNDVFEVYTQYGDSTKENTNNAVGMLGIGSKSGFAYSDSFTVTSWHAGQRSVYVAVLEPVEDEEGNEQTVGVMRLLHQEECPIDDTGIEVMIAVRPEDVYDFQEKAKNLYQHFNPRPEINIALPEVPEEQTVLTNGAISGQAYYGSEWVALMGCVPYRLNLTKLDQARLAKCLPKLHGVLYFNIGDVDISVSREELEYTRRTKEKILQKFDDLIDEYVTRALVDLENASVSDWDKRLKVQVLDQMGLPLPDKYEDLAKKHVKITYAPGTFTLLHGSNVAVMLTIAANTRLLLDDTGKTLANYHLGEHDYVVRAAEGRSLDDTQNLLTEALAKSGLTGVKIAKLSECHYYTPPIKAKKQTNPKHKAKMFVMKTGYKSFAAPYSTYWDTVTREAEDTDVYVVISHFQPYSGFWNEMLSDMKLAECFGVTTFPQIFAYKETEKVPVDLSKVKGKEYRVWRKEFFQSLLTPDNLAKIQEYFWNDPIIDGHISFPTKQNRLIVINDLGAGHPISVLLERQASCKVRDGVVGQLADLVGITRESSEAGKAYLEICRRYPLLGKGNLDELWPSYYQNASDPSAQEWRDYVKMVDERDNLRMHVAVQPVTNLGIVDPFDAQALAQA